MAIKCLLAVSIILWLPLLVVNIAEDDCILKDERIDSGIKTRAFNEINWEDINTAFNTDKNLIRWNNYDVMISVNSQQNVLELYLRSDSTIYGKKLSIQNLKTAGFTDNHVMDLEIPYILFTSNHKQIQYEINLLSDQANIEINFKHIDLNIFIVLPAIQKNKLDILLEKYNALFSEVTKLKTETKELKKNLAFTEEKVKELQENKIKEIKVGDLKYSAIDGNHNNWLLCDGKSYPKEKYPILYSIINGKFGAMRSDSFNVPDFRGKVPGVISNKYKKGAMIGNEEQQLTNAQLPPHFHYIASSQEGRQGAVNDQTNPYLCSHTNYIGPSQAYEFRAVTNVPNVFRTGQAIGSASRPFSIMQPTLFAGNIFIYGG